MSSRKIEELAVIAVKQRLFSCEVLDVYIDTNDRTPITDGIIRIIENGEQSKVLGEIAVQVKGTKGGRSTHIPKYSVPRKCLDYAANNNGLVFFLSCLSGKNDQDIKICYRIFSPNEARQILDEHQGGTVSLTLGTLDDLDSFQRQLCVAIKQAKYSNLSDFSTRGNASIISTLLMSDKRVSLDEEGFELDSDNGDRFLLIATDEEGRKYQHSVGKIRFESVYEDILLTVQSGGILYDCAQLNIHQRTICLSLSSVLSICTGGEFSEATASIAFEFDAETMLEHVLKAAKFIQAMSESGVLTIGSDEVPIEILGFEKSNFANLVKEILELDNVLCELNLNVDELKVSDIQSLGIRLLKNLQQSFNGELTEEFDDAPIGVVYIPVGQYRYTCILAEIEGKRKLVDPFLIPGDGEQVVYPIMELGEKSKVEVTIYDVMSDAQLKQSLNASIENAFEHYARLKDFEGKYSLANQFGLRCLALADDPDVKGERFLEGALRIFGWLRQEFPSDGISIVNYFQTMKRKGPLTEGDEDELRLLAVENDNLRNVEMRLAIAGILEEPREFSFLLRKVDNALLEEFKKYPIWTLFERTPMLQEVILSHDRDNVG